MAAVQLAIGQLAIDRAERRICKVVAQWFRAHMGRGLGTISIGTKKFITVVLWEKIGPFWGANDMVI